VDKLACRQLTVTVACYVIYNGTVRSDDTAESSDGTAVTNNDTGNEMRTSTLTEGRQQTVEINAEQNVHVDYGGAGL